MNESRILLVDDEELFLDATAEMLRQKGFACDVAMDAASATDLIQEHDYDAVIADIKMPGNSNLEFVRLLEEQASALPVVLVTGYPSLETAIESVNLDVIAYLVKPVDMGDLLAHVHEAVSKSQTHDLIQRIRERAQNRIQKLDQLEADAPGTRDASSVLESIFELTFQNVADTYVDLRQLFSIMEQREPAALATGLRNDPIKQKLIDALEHTIEVLEETKRAFKSKQLARLRQRLESVLTEVTA